MQFEPDLDSDPSKISSDPTRVCLCENGTLNCSITSWSETHYPGEEFTISAMEERTPIYCLTDRLLVFHMLQIAPKKAIDMNQDQSSGGMMNDNQYRHQEGTTPQVQSHRIHESYCRLGTNIVAPH